MNSSISFSWQVSKKLLISILEDKVSDRFVCELVWERLYYVKEKNFNNWECSNKTPLYWSDKFKYAPQIIAERPASIHLTRSIDKNSKNGLKEFISFKGYKINELYPRRTRRATAVNWLIFWAKESNYLIQDEGALPNLKTPPINPILGHPNDLPIT